MKVVANPSEELAKKKPLPKLTGGEPFDAEPGLAEPSESWLNSQAALLKLTIKEQPGWGNYLPQLDMLQQGYNYDGYEYDEEVGQYYLKQWLTFKVSYRYYKGNRKRSYLFWPKHVSPGYSTMGLIRKSGGKKVFRVIKDTGWADYALVGEMNLGGGATTTVLALWRSNGTMKARKGAKSEDPG